MEGCLWGAQMKKLHLRRVVCRAQTFMNSDAKCTLPCFQDIINSSFILLLAYCLFTSGRATGGIRQRRVRDSVFPAERRTRELYWNFNFSVWYERGGGGSKLEESREVDLFVIGCRRRRFCKWLSSTVSDAEICLTRSLYLVSLKTRQSSQICEDTSRGLHDNGIYQQ